MIERAPSRENLFEVSAATIASFNHPEENQDYYFCSEQGAGVFDGLGSHSRSSEASKIAGDLACELMREVDISLAKEESARQLTRILHLCHQAITKYQASENIRLATTAAIAQIFEDPDTQQKYVQIAHAGDSRVYIVRSNEVVLETLDHSAGYEDLGATGYRDVQQRLNDEENYTDMNPWDAFFARQRNYVGSTLGGQRQVIDTQAFDVDADDILLLTTDGIHDNLKTSEMLECTKSVPFYALGDTLVHRAHDQSKTPRYSYREFYGESHKVQSFRAKPDYMTAVVMKII